MEQENSFPGLELAVRRHLEARVITPDADIITQISSHTSAPWNMQLVAEGASDIELRLEVKDPAAIERLKSLKTFVHWKTNTDWLDLYSGSIKLSKDVSKSVKYLVVILHKVLAIPYDTELVYRFITPSVPQDVPTEDKPTSTEMASILPEASEGSRSLEANTSYNAQQEKKHWSVGKIILMFVCCVSIIGMLIWLLPNLSSTDSHNSSQYIEEEVAPEYLDFHGYMDWEYGITLRISNGEGQIDGVYNNNKYQNTFLDIKGVCSDNHYNLVLYKKNGSEMGTFSLVRSGSNMLGAYHDIQSDTDHRVEISCDPNSPIPLQEDPDKVIQRELEAQAEIEEEIQYVREPNGHSYVDLGLPSGLCWATCNLGASSPTSNGEHYSWGETSEKYEYTQSSYNCNFGSRMLTSSNDAASVQWGGTWRMPTSEEWQELDTYCTWSWDGEGYYVKGNNGNSIFLPAAGYSKGSSRFKAGERGDYWTSTPCGSEKAYEFVIKSDSRRIENDNRHYGLSIRPVIE